MAVMDSAHYGVCIYFRVPDLPLYTPPHEKLDGGLGRLSRVPADAFDVCETALDRDRTPQLLPAGYAEEVFCRTECTVWDETPHSGYYQYS